MADEIKHIVSIEANLTKIQSQLGTLEGNFKSSFGRIQGLAQGLGGVLGGALSIGGLIAFGKHVIDIGDQLSDLSDQTGNSIAVLGGIKPILEQNNTSLDSFAKGMARAQRSLGDINGAGKEAAEGLKAIGLNAADLANVSPDEFLERFANALSKVENRNERAAIAARVFGKAAAEMVPSILALAENGIPKLSKETENAYKQLGALKDQITALTAKLIDLSAVPLAKIATDIRRLFSGSTQEEVLGGQVTAIDSQIRKLEGDLARIIGATDPVFNKQRAVITAQLAELSRQKRTLTDSLDTIPKPTAKTPVDGGLKNLLPDKKSMDQTQSFMEGLSKQFDSLQSKQVGQLFGPQAELGAQLDASFKEFQAKMAADNIPIPKGLDAQFDKIKTSILGANLQLTQTATELEKIAALGKILNQDSGEWLNVDEDLAKANVKVEEFRKQLDDLRQGLQLGAMETKTPQGAEKKRIAEIEVEFVKTANRITEIGTQAGASQEQIAADIALAWKKALADIGIEADKSLRESFENVFGAIEHGFEETLNGVLQGTQTFGDAMKNLARNILLSIADEVNKQLILKPLKKFLGGLLPGADEQQPNVPGFNLANNSPPSLPDFSFAHNPEPPQIPMPDISNFTFELSEQAKTGFDNLSTGISGGLNNLLSVSQSGFGGFFDFLESTISSSLDSLSELASSAGDWISGIFKDSGSSGGGGFLGVIGSFFEDLFKKEGGPILPLHFSRGGAVPAILHEGEFVNRRSSVAKYGLPFFEKLNAGQLQIPNTHFAFGGRVGNLAVNWRSMAAGGAVGQGRGDAVPGWGGGKTTVIVNNNTGQPVETDRRRTIDGEEIFVTIGKRTAHDIRANRDVGRAISETFGVGRAPINRG